MAKKPAPAFSSRDDLRAAQITALIGVLQAADPDFNLTRAEATATKSILERWGLTVLDIAANQQTNQPAQVAMRNIAELDEMGIPADAPLYYHLLIGNTWHECAELLKDMKAPGFDTNGFREIWTAVVPANMPNNNVENAVFNVNVGGRTIGAAVGELLRSITRDELAKLPE